jgi:hypothetical protein
LIGWRRVFTIASGVLFSASLFYMIFASGELQSWSTGTQREQKIRLSSEKLPPLLGSFQHNLQDGNHSRNQDKKHQQSVVNGAN